MHGGFATWLPASATTTAQNADATRTGRALAWADDAGAWLHPELTLREAERILELVRERVYDLERKRG